MVVRVHPFRASLRALGLVLCFLAFSSLFAQVAAQSSSTPSPSPTVPPNVTVVPLTSTYNVTSTYTSGSSTIPTTIPVSSVYNVTLTLSPSPTSSANATATPAPITLDTVLDPGFGVLGAILILTGLPSAFWGHKNRWTSFFLIGFYTLSLVCFVLILKFGVLGQVNPPSTTLRGMFVLASVIAGLIGGAITIFFWQATKYFIGAWGGLAFALWIQCFKDGGVISPIGLRWILYIACGVIGFVLCTIPKLHWHVVLVATAFVGASAFILGVDCFTTAGLKEFYIWNLGFDSLFVKYTSNGIAFPVTQTMEIELGLMAAIAVMGGAVQLRVLQVLQRKLKEIKEEQRRRDEEAELNAAGAFSDISKEREEWERDHPTLTKHGRNDSRYSNTPLMKDFPGDGSNEPGSSTFTLVGDRRQRYQSGVSEFMAAPTSDDEMRRATMKSGQLIGALPALDLGSGIQEDVPSSFIADNEGESSDGPRKPLAATPSELDDIQRKEELLAEIQTIRRSIDALRSETPVSTSTESRSRHPSLTSRRTLSQDLDAVLRPTHARPPRQTAPRGRVVSLELDSLVNNTSSPRDEPIGRPTSVPLRDDGWDSYVQDRKLLQPPSGVTAPIPTTPLTSQRISMPQAVAVAVAERKRRESWLDSGRDAGRESGSGGADTPAKETTSSDDVPVAVIAQKAQTRRSRQFPGNPPPQPPSPPSNVPLILPPQRKSAPKIVAPTPQRPDMARVATFEELEERHREKLRNMQAPLTQAEKEHADIEAAKTRWERSKAVEKELVAKRQAEKAAQLAKEGKNKKDDKDGRRRSAAQDLQKAGERPQRSLSADKLATMGNSTSSKRMSTLKVEDWQRYQQDVEMGVRPATGSAPAKRDSRLVNLDVNATVPFPAQSRPRDSLVDRGRPAGLPRDPPS